MYLCKKKSAQKVLLSALILNNFNLVKRNYASQESFFLQHLEANSFLNFPFIS